MLWLQPSRASQSTDGATEPDILPQFFPFALAIEIELLLILDGFHSDVISITGNIDRYLRGESPFRTPHSLFSRRGN